MIQHISPQLAILFDGPQAHVCILADWRHQLVAFKATLDWTSASRRCIGQLVAKVDRQAGVGMQGGGALGYVCSFTGVRTRMRT